MATAGSPSADPAARIASIIRMQALLFGASTPREYEELLDFPEDRRSTKIERVVSILRSQELLLGSGAFLGGARARSAAAEIPGLVAYLRAIVDADRAQMRTGAILPRNLGRTFAERRWGLPLFGDFRPAIPPERGLLLLYSSPDGDGESGALEATRLGPDCRLAYQGRALALDSSGSWLRLLARATASLGEGASGWRRDPRSDAFSYSCYELALDRAPGKRGFRGRIADPYEYVYPYCFFDAPTAALNLARFVGDILCGVFRVPLREAEKLAEAFSGRLP